MAEPTVPPLSPDLGPTVLQSELAFVRATIVHVEPDDAVPRPRLELRVDEVLRGEVPATIQVPYVRPTDRLVRAKDARNAWSSLALVPGTILLLALEPGTWIAIAGLSIPTPGDPAVAALREAIRIHALPLEPAARRAPLEAALASLEHVLRRFALRAIPDTGIYSRSESIDIYEAASGAAPTPKIAFEVASQMSIATLFLVDAWADRSNARILRSLARGLARAQAEERLPWARCLAALTMSSFTSDPAQSERIRRALLLELDLGEPARAFDVVGELVTRGNDLERQVLGPLHACWKAVRAVPVA